MTSYGFLTQIRTTGLVDLSSHVVDNDGVAPVWVPTDTRIDALFDDGSLSDAHKRAVLADWASDRRTMANLPSLRQLDDGTIVHIDDILHALRSLDRPAAFGAAPRHAIQSRRASRERSTARGWFKKSFKRRRTDDDDDPPPCPAGRVPPFGPSPMQDAVGVMLAA